MNYEEYLLVHLMEEASEVVKACSKALRFGLDHLNEREGMTNRVHIAHELMNLNSHASKCIVQGLFSNGNDPAEVNAAFEKGTRMLQLSMELGRITDGRM